MAHPITITSNRVTFKTMAFFTTLLILLALIGAPLFTVLASVALLASYTEEISPDILIIEMNRLTTSPNMVALPLFILAGVIMANGGAPKRLVAFYRANFGFLPGGIAVVRSEERRVGKEC